MKKKIINGLLILLLIAGFSGCVIVSIGETGSVEGRGNLESYTIEVDEYNKLKIEGFCIIQYYSEHSDSVTLEIQPNLREYYSLEVKDGELIVKTTKRINPGFGKTIAPVLTVSNPGLTGIDIAGAGTIKSFDMITGESFSIKLSGAADGSAEFAVENLNVDIAGAGQLKLSGTAENAVFTLSGASDINALSLETKETKINLAGASSVKVNCSETLEINAGGVGSVEYRGSPSLKLDTGGLVSIKQVN